VTVGDSTLGVAERDRARRGSVNAGIVVASVAEDSRVLDLHVGGTRHVAGPFWRGTTVGAPCAVVVADTLLSYVEPTAIEGVGVDAVEAAGEPWVFNCLRALELND